MDSKTAGYTKSELKRAQHLYKGDAAREMLINGSAFKAATTTDFPQNLARVAITSGSLLGPHGMQSNSVTENQFIANFKFYLFYTSGGTLIPSSSWSMPFYWYSRNINGVYYDNAPGSNENTYREAYLKFRESAAKFENWNEAQNNNVTFIPTISSLAIPVPPLQR